MLAIGSAQRDLDQGTEGRPVDERIAWIRDLIGASFRADMTRDGLRGDVARDLARLIQAEVAARRLVVAVSDVSRIESDCLWQAEAVVGFDPPIRITAVVREPVAARFAVRAAAETRDPLTPIGIRSGKQQLANERLSAKQDLFLARNGDGCAASEAIGPATVL